MTRRRLLRLTIAGAVAAAAAPAVWALAIRPADESGPPEVAYGRDRCEACGMIISDPRFAAAARQNSAVRRYDDIGCLIRHSGEPLTSGAAVGFVHDLPSEGWIKASRAWYVRSPAIRTPMNYGIAAYADEAAARRAHPDTPAVAFEALLATLAQEPS